MDEKLKEKILKGIMCCFPDSEDEELKLCCSDCPYWDDGKGACDSEGIFITENIINDMRRLLKGKEGQA